MHSGISLRRRYHRMDGSTAVGVRARLVDDFNTNAEVFVFLLTTKVGGLGINLTGADRSALRSTCLLVTLHRLRRPHECPQSCGRAPAGCQPLL